MEWQTATDELIKDLPFQQAEWLLEFGSLTQKLASVVGDVKLDVLAEQHGDLLESERGLLSGSEHHWVREVVLHGTDSPWIYARTVMPAQHCDMLKSLGNTPLGSVLFTDGSLRRHSLEVKKITSTSALWPSDILEKSAPDYLWARRSVWKSVSENSSHETPYEMVVSEVFLPDAPLYS